MNGVTYEDTIAALRAQSRQQLEALERIAARCDAVNFPPDLVVDIAAMARQGLNEARPAPGRPERRAAAHELRQDEIRA